MKKRCETALQQTKEHDDYFPSRQWCVKEEAATNILKKKGFRTLNANSNEDDEHWNTIINQDSENQVAISGGKTVNSMKKICQSLKIEGLKTTSEDFNYTLRTVQDSCSIKIQI